MFLTQKSKSIAMCPIFIVFAYCAVQCASQIKNCEQQFSEANSDENIIMFVDETGSMISHRQELIETYNNFLKTQSKSNPNRKFTVIFFNTQFSIHEYTKISKAPLLTDNIWDEGMTVYNPGYNSHIYNTLGCALHGYHGVKSGDCNAKTRVVLFSNGQNLNENEDIYDQNEVKDIISGLRGNCSWKFNFVGMIQDSYEENKLRSWAEDIGFTAEEISVTVSEDVGLTRKRRSGAIQRVFLEVEEALKRK